MEQVALAPAIAEEPGMGTVERFPIDPTEETLHRLLTELFERHWAEIVFGTLIQGAVFEIHAPGAPRRIGYYDGYLTIDFGVWHMHLCIGEHRGSKGNPVDPELARWRRCARAELYRQIAPQVGGPVSWGLRLFNGRDEQQLTVFLPNPFLGPDDSILDKPDWSRLALWDSLRKDYLGLEPDPADRTAARFWHG